MLAYRRITPGSGNRGESPPEWIRAKQIHPLSNHQGVERPWHSQASFSWGTLNSGEVQGLAQLAIHIPMIISSGCCGPPPGHSSRSRSVGWWQLFPENYSGQRELLAGESHYSKQGFKCHAPCFNLWQWFRAVLSLGLPWDWLCLIPPLCSPAFWYSLKELILRIYPSEIPTCKSLSQRLFFREPK